MLNLYSCLQILRDEKGVSTFDFVFIDHFKQYYLSDLLRLKQNGFLRDGSIVVADNVGYPGVPDYLEFMEQTSEFQTTHHKSKLEYTKTVDDVVLVSVYKKP